jgi:NAD(P)-dependent dehydrogenase (short-subunit alcohol dehydrogenase family)
VDSVTRDISPVPDYGHLPGIESRVFVVLGGGNGIGRQTCHALAQSGASVVCVDQVPELASAVAEEIGGLALVGDVATRGDVERLFDEASKQAGPVRGVVDIVGMPLVGPLASLDDDGWKRQFDLVLTHAFLALQIGGASIAQSGGGAMVFVSSLAGLIKIPGHGAYGAAKAALIHLVAEMGQELGPSGVRVNAIAPGFVRTPRVSALFSDSQWAAIEEQIPIGVAGTTPQMAGPILFLCSDLAAYVTGQTVIADGGLGGTFRMPSPEIP